MSGQGVSILISFHMYVLGLSLLLAGNGDIRNGIKNN
jgi:hypothetical protein